MVGMAVVDANQVHTFRPCVVIHVQHLDRIDDVTAGSVFRRGFLPTPGFDPASRVTDVAKPEAATFPGEPLGRMPCAHSNRAVPEADQGCGPYLLPK